jgi:HEXXH motif-containing protein
MKLNAHKIPAQAFGALAEGGGGHTAACCLAAAQFSKHVLLLRRVVDLSQSAGNDQANLAKQAFDQLAALQEERPDVVSRVIQYPAVGAWAKQTVDVLSSARSTVIPGLSWLPAVTAAAAIRSRIPCSVVMPADHGVAMLPSLGCATVTAGNVRVGHDGAAIDGVPLPADPSEDADGWQGLRRLSAQARGKSLELLIDDLDPHRAPGMDNFGDRLTAAEVADWQSALDGAWGLLVRHHPTVAEEIATVIRVLTPLRPPPGGHVSATSRDAFGAILLSKPSDACSLAVTMAHEVQHAKLSALLDVAPMTLPDDGRRFYAPWREDPRPVSGLLQGAYAFLGVAAFWRRQSRLRDGESAIAEYARWRSAVRLVVDTLRMSGRLTDPGEVFVSGMDRTLQSWEIEPIPQGALAKAQRAGEEHAERWRQRNGEIPMPHGEPGIPASAAR